MQSESFYEILAISSWVLMERTYLGKTYKIKINLFPAKFAKANHIDQ